MALPRSYLAATPKRVIGTEAHQWEPTASDIAADLHVSGRSSIHQMLDSWTKKIQNIQQRFIDISFWLSFSTYLLGRRETYVFASKRLVRSHYNVKFFKKSMSLFIHKFQNMCGGCVNGKHVTLLPGNDPSGLQEGNSPKARPVTYSHLIPPISAKNTSLSLPFSLWPKCLLGQCCCYRDHNRDRNQFPDQWSHK